MKREIERESAIERDGGGGASCFKNAIIRHKLWALSKFENWVSIGDYPQSSTSNCRRNIYIIQLDHEIIKKYTGN